MPATPQAQVVTNRTNLTIGAYIRTKRELLNLTQEQLVNLLNERSNFFDLSESVTISRWESGVVAPNFKRFMALLQALEEENLFITLSQLYHQGLFDSHIRSFDKSLNRINYFRKHPYTRDHVLRFISTYPNAERRKLLSYTEGYKGSFSEKIFNLLIRHHDWKTLCLYREATTHGELSGHLLGIKLSTNAFENFSASGQIPKNFFDIESGIETIFCILSFYPGSNEVFTRLMGDCIIDLCRDRLVTQVVVLCHNESLARSFSALNFDVTQKFNGIKNKIKVDNNHYDEIFMQKNKKDILQDRSTVCTILRAMNPTSILQ